MKVAARRRVVAVLSALTLAAAVSATSIAFTVSPAEARMGICQLFKDWREADPWPNPDDEWHTGDAVGNPNTWDPEGEWYPEGDAFASFSLHEDWVEGYTLSNENDFHVDCDE